MIVSFRLSQIAKGTAAGAALLFLGLHGACAQDVTNKAGMPHGMSAHHFNFGEPGKAGTIDRTVNIAMEDLRFEPASLIIRRGETIRFVVSNHSEIDHDFTLGDAATQIAHRKEMAEMMANGGRMHHHDDPNAMMVGPGQVKQLIWTFSRTGKLQFDCNIPGHYEAGMRGTITVVDKQ